MQNRTSNLVGRDIVLTVSEPWDYCFPHGDNTIELRVVSFNMTTDELCAEAGSEISVRDGAIQGTRLLISPRYRGERISGIRNSRHGIVVGVGLVPSAAPDNEAVYAFVGSVRLAERPAS